MIWILQIQKRYIPDSVQRVVQIRVQENFFLDNVSIHRNFQNWFLKGNERKLDFVQFDISKAFDSIHKKIINVYLNLEISVVCTF